ncbi:MAG: SDR family NAD(P)-dependent oxidoreductase, partial [Arenicellales bacterium]|nr:SDR family NAD(P)-dependent oxidoreductase [Arenicellales bacterium]
MTSDRRVAVVTGGASGIGEGCVCKMASEGYHVVVADRDIGKARALVEELTTIGQSVSMESIDVADSTSVDECASIVQGKYGRLD